MFRHFFGEMFLNKADTKSESLKLPKLCVFGLKYDFSVKKDKKDHNFSASTILNMDDSVLNTFQYCEKVRDHRFRLIRDTIFSGLVKYQ